MTKKIMVVSAPVTGFDYYTEVAADSPIAWYHFDSSTVMTDSVNGWNGIYTPGGNNKFPTTLSTSTPIPIDRPDSKSLTLPYTAGLVQYADRVGYVPIGSPYFTCPIGTSNSWTVEFWFRTSGMHCGLSNRVDYILSGGTDTSNFWAFEATSSYSIASTKYFSGYSIFNYSFRIKNTHWLFTEMWDIEQWHHFVISYAHTTKTLELYVDGVLKDDATTGTISTSGPGGTQRARLGLSDLGLIRNTSYIAQLAYYDYHLPAARVKRHYDAAP